jgi:hypothetical protein
LGLSLLPNRQFLPYKVPASRVYCNVTITVDTPYEIDTYAGQISY